MKKFLLAFIAVVMCIDASAKSGYDRLGVSYNYIDVGAKLNGVSLSWTKGISLSKSLPLFLETGIGATYAAKKKDGTKNLYVGAAIPLNIAYKVSLDNSDIKITPAIGFYLRGNIYGETKYPEMPKDYVGIYLNKQEWYSGNGDNPRFQVGYQAGLVVEYHKLYVGVSYGGDFSETTVDYRAEKAKTLTATVGIIF